MKYGVGNHDRPCSGILVSKVHSCIVVVLGIIDPAHHSLVIAEEEYGQTGDAIDSDEESALLQVVYDIVPRDARFAKPKACRLILFIDPCIKMFIARLYGLGQSRVAITQMQRNWKGDIKDSFSSMSIDF